MRLTEAQQKELSAFNLDKMKPAALKCLVKVSDVLGNLDSEAWHDFIIDGGLNINLIAIEAEVSRSSLYQNPHLKRYVTGKAEGLLSEGLIAHLPYQKKENRSSAISGTNKYSVSESELREKNETIKALQTKVAELTGIVDGLKDELHIANARLTNTDQREKHLLKFGRYPR